VNRESSLHKRPLTYSKFCGLTIFHCTLGQQSWDCSTRNVPCGHENMQATYGRLGGCATDGFAGLKSQERWGWHFRQFISGTSQACPDQKNLAVCFSNGAPQSGQIVGMDRVPKELRNPRTSRPSMPFFVTPSLTR
jgi:hypothetical protein